MLEVTDGNDEKGVEKLWHRQADAELFPAPSEGGEFSDHGISNEKYAEETRSRRGHKLTKADEMDGAARISGPSAGGSAAEIRSWSDYKPEKADGQLRREGRRLASNP